MLFSVSDDTLDTPFGAILDATVGYDGAVYLLDKQTFDVRRFGPGGEVLPAVGRKGEGPGEFTMPLKLAVYPDGRCLVLQDFYRPAACFTPEGVACERPDLEQLRRPYFVVVFSRVLVDPQGRLVLGVVANRRAHGSVEPRGEDDFVAFVARLDSPEGGEATTLFSSDIAGDNPGIVELPPSSQAFVFRGWDVSPSGRFIYSDPDLAYRVYIGLPSDEDSRVVDLPARHSDEANLRRVANEFGTDADPGDLRRVLYVGWLDDEYFIVEPATAAVQPNEDLIGTFEVFNLEGDSYGLHSIRCAYDPSQDAFYVCRDRLIVIRGGRSAMRASFAALKDDGSSSRAHNLTRDDIRLDVYEIFGDLRR